MTYQLRNVMIAVALGLLAAVLTTIYVTNYRKHVQHGAQSVPVLVAAVDIPAGTAGSAIVAGHMLKTESVPRTALVPGAISSPAQIARLATIDQIIAGEQITVRRFGTDQQLGIRAQLKGTLRAIQIAADGNQILAGTLKAGDHVDVVANLKVEAGQAASTVHYDRIVLRNLLVLKAPSFSSKGDVTSSKYSVMLAVTDAQSSKLMFVVKNADPNGATDGGWALELRPVTNSADSPDNVDSIATVLLDGLSPAERSRIVSGALGTN
jgi:Flp pilus assembly protein CpaB